MDMYPKGGDLLNRQHRRWGMLLVLTLLVISQTGCLNATSNEEYPQPVVTDNWVKEKLKSMSLEEKVGQLFMVGFEDTPQKKATQVNQHAESLVKDYHVGGVILFGRNISSTKQIVELTNDLQKLALSEQPQIPLLISIDQEGGKITRIREGITVFPGNMPLGATRDPQLARQAAHVMGKDLYDLGVHLNFAPVMDVNNNPKNPVIGVRSFGSDPHLVAEMGVAMIQGFHDAGIFTAVKHFPGHGDTSVDSHISLPTIHHDRKRLEEVELVPFKKAIEAGTDFVMTAHVTFPAIEPTPGLPATLSKRVLTDLLRNELGYQGVIITDDMEMGAIANQFGTGEAAVQAIEAGADMILVCHTLEKQKDAILAIRKAVEDGRISEERINESVKRILELKAKKMGEHSLVSKPYREPIEERDVHKLAQEIADQSVTFVQGSFEVLNPKQHPQLLVLTNVDKNRVKQAFQHAGYNPTVQVVDELDEDKIDEIWLTSRSYKAIVIAVENLSKEDLWVDLIKKLDNENTSVVVLGLGVPYDAKLIPKKVPFIALYGSTSTSLQAGAKAIAGQIEMKGQLPVKLTSE